MPSVAPHVLIVDSDQTFARTIARLLTQNGYDAATLSTASALTEYLATRTVDLLLLDLALPGEDGFSIFELLGRNPDARGIPVLALWAGPPEEESLRAPDLGAAEVIAKPVQGRELLARIRAQLRASGAHNQARAEARSQAALVELLGEITVELPPRELFQVLVRQVAATLRIPRCSILFGGRGAERMRVAAASENPMLNDLSIDTRRYPEIQRALDTGQVVLVRDAATDPLYQGMSSIETRSSLVLPFSLRGQRAGVFFLRTGDGDPPLGDTDLRFAARVADSAVPAIEKALDSEAAGPPTETPSQIAETDPLTGLLNRGALEVRLTAEVARAQRDGTALSCILIHLADHKRLDVTHGGHMGDRVLAQFAELLRRDQRPVDVAGRFGDDEFAVLLPETGVVAARLFAERLLHRAGPVRFGDPDAPVAVELNLGIATFDRERGTPGGSLLETAGQHLLRAKSDGRNNYRD